MDTEEEAQGISTEDVEDLMINMGAMAKKVIIVGVETITTINKCLVINKSTTTKVGAMPIMKG